MFAFPLVRDTVFNYSSGMTCVSDPAAAKHWMNPVHDLPFLSLVSLRSIFGCFSRCSKNGEPFTGLALSVCLSVTFSLRGRLDACLCHCCETKEDLAGIVVQRWEEMSLWERVVRRMPSACMSARAAHRTLITVVQEWRTLTETPLDFQCTPESTYLQPSDVTLQSVFRSSSSL